MLRPATRSYLLPPSGVSEALHDAGGFGRSRDAFQLFRI